MTCAARQAAHTSTKPARRTELTHSACAPARRLSSSLGNLTALTELRLGGNELTALPDWLGNLTALRTLHLGGTGLAAPELA